MTSPPAGRPGQPVADWLFIALWLAATAIGLYAALATPPFINPDEGAHYLRSNEVAHGRLLNRPGKVGIEMPCEEYRTAAARYYPMAYYRPVDALLAADPTGCRANSRNTVGMYPPVPYLASAIGMRLAESANTSAEAKMVAGRAANMLATSALGLIALLMIRSHRALLAFLMLMPESLWLRSALSADAMTITLAVLFLAYLIRLTERQRPVDSRELAILMLLGGLIGLTKVVYGVICFASLALYGTGSGRPLRVFLRLALPGVISLGAAYAWMTWVAPDLVYLGHGAVPAAQWQTLLAEPGRFPMLFWKTMYHHGGEMLYSALIPSLWVPVPVGQAIAVLLALLFCAIALASPAVFPRPGSLLLAALTLLGAFAVTAPPYLTFTPVGHWEIWGIQGRYFIPLAALPVLALGLRNIPAGVREKSPTGTLLATASVVAVDGFLAAAFLG